jgi:hypothetical protein
MFLQNANNRLQHGVITPITTILSLYKNYNAVTYWKNEERKVTRTDSILIKKWPSRMVSHPRRLPYLYTYSVLMGPLNEHSNLNSSDRKFQMQSESQFLVSFIYKRQVRCSTN